MPLSLLSSRADMQIENAYTINHVLSSYCSERYMLEPSDVFYALHEELSGSSAIGPLLVSNKGSPVIITSCFPST